MNPRQFEALAAQHQAQIQESVAGSRPHIGRSRDRQHSLRTRTGWTLVDLGLKLVAQPHRPVPARPRPAGS